ncbi:serine/threonine-protein kinase [Nocardia inohanensis]|uniref:serine/threonine-protein kinase n=1 Tax=Nocardia inohanensis TaxID=209246 RepID=UPI00082D8392|nr:serine/threonine-protein kinase [Nocardia inohanensis]
MADGYLGRYRLDELLGSGGSAQVWRAHDTETGRTATLKLLAPVLTADPEYRRRFEREARAASLLHGPHVVAVRAFGELEGRLYIESEFVDGLDIEALLEWEGPFAPAAAVGLIAQIAAALDEAHAAGLVHRDVKPQNIIVAPDDTAYLIDFGSVLDDGQTSITRSGMLIGTPAYLAPERYAGIAGARSDIYSLACVLYECLTGQRPFRTGNPAQLMRAQLETDPPAASSLAPAVSIALDRVIARGMAKDPAQRYASAGEFAAAAAIAAEAPGIDPPGTQPIPDARPVSGTRPEVSGNPGAVAGVLAVSLAVVALAAWVITLGMGVVWFTGHTGSAPTPASTPTATADAKTPARETIPPSAPQLAASEPETTAPSGVAPPDAASPSAPAPDSDPREPVDHPGPSHHGGSAHKPDKPGKSR